MYCSIEEAWPTHQLNNLKHNNDYTKDVNEKENYNEFMKFINKKKEEKKEKEKEEKKDKEVKEDQQTEHFNNNYNKFKILNKQCDSMLNHISTCDDCLKKIYKRYNCSKNNNILSELITDKNKDMILIVFIGLLIILVLQLFTSID
jgi:hypothetical protein